MIIVSYKKTTVVWRVSLISGPVRGTCMSHHLPSYKFSKVPEQAITKTHLFKYIENFISKKGKFSEKKNCDIFCISAQNIDCGYSLEPPLRGGSNEYHNFCF